MMGFGDSAQTIRVRGPFVAALGVGVAAFVGAGLAWACTPDSDIWIQPRSGSSGSTVTVTGNTFGEKTVELRWGSTRGELLATVRGPSFATTVTIPAASAGAHYVQAVARNEDGTIAGAPAAPFSVVAPAPTPGGGAGTGSGAGGVGSAGAPASGGQVVPGPGAGKTGKAPTRGLTTSGREHSKTRRQGGRSDGSGGRRTVYVPASRGNASAPQTIRAPSGNAVFADSLMPPGRATGRAGRANAATNRTGVGASGPSTRSAASDLWGGFSAGRGPALTDVGRSLAPATRPGSQLAFGAGLLGAGVLALVGGLAIAEARRRRARAHASGAYSPIRDS